MPRVVVVTRFRTLTAQWAYLPTIGQNLQPFTGNGDVFIWVKNSRVGKKPLKQTKIFSTIYIGQLCLYDIACQLYNLLCITIFYHRLE